MAARATRASNLDGLRKLIDARRVELQLTMLDVDIDAELQDGYFAKLMCGMRNFGPKSLDAVLTALRVDICLTPRPGGSDERPRGSSAAKANREL
jgi:hypothetical protein